MIYTFHEMKFTNRLDDKKFTQYQDFTRGYEEHIADEVEKKGMFSPSLEEALEYGRYKKIVMVEEQLRRGRNIDTYKCTMCENGRNKFLHCYGYLGGSCRLYKKDGGEGISKRELFLCISGIIYDNTIRIPSYDLELGVLSLPVPAV